MHAFRTVSLVNSSCATEQHTRSNQKLHAQINRFLVRLRFNSSRALICLNRAMFHLINRQLNSSACNAQFVATAKLTEAASELEVSHKTQLTKLSLEFGDE
jgi:hypothetical protein